MEQFVSKIQEKFINTANFNFNEIAIQLFYFQYNHNSIYQQFIDYLKINIHNIEHYTKIPFLPISFFKTHKLLIDNAPTTKIFESSGTTRQINSKHYVADLKIYEKNFTNIFQQFYGNVNDYIILALLPSYLERNTSSLVYMVQHLIAQSKDENSGFYLNDLAALQSKLVALKNQKKKIILIGVTFALLDFAEQFAMDLQDVLIMETGGMKGRRKEILREEVHTILKNAFNVKNIHSEYGMTELLSQAYSKGDGIFETPKQLKILKRDIYNPLLVTENSGRGALNVIDLANIYSCAFIATQDIVSIDDNNKFEIIGRTDYADVRGCNLMVV